VAESPDMQSDIAGFLAATRLDNVTDAEGRRWLAIPGHGGGNIPAHEPSQRRWGSQPPDKFYEEPVTLLMSYLLDRLRPKTFFDVGAWQGHFSLVAASHLAARPTVHAFDMRPHGIDALAARARAAGLSERVHAHLVGLSDRHVGPTRVWYARMKMFEHEPKPSEYRESIWRRLKFFLRGSKSRGLRPVDLQVTTLDRFCSDNGVVPELMKIDVDGYEGKILRGASGLLNTVKPTILLELHKDEVQREGIYRVDVAAMLFAAGYAGYFLTDHHRRETCRLLPVRPGDALLARQETDMVLFVPPHLTGRIIDTPR